MKQLNYLPIASADKASDLQHYAAEACYASTRFIQVGSRVQLQAIYADQRQHRYIELLLAESQAETR